MGNVISSNLAALVDVGLKNTKNMYNIYYLRSRKIRRFFVVLQIIVHDTFQLARHRVTLLRMLKDSRFESGGPLDVQSNQEDQHKVLRELHSFSFWKIILL